MPITDHGLEMINHPSPNFTERRGDARATMVVLHYTGMQSARAAAERLCDPVAEVSAHYLICEAGRVYRLVAEDMRAWHAGASSWGDVSDVNSQSIGIELANPGHEFGYPPFPDPQMTTLERLLAGIMYRWSIPPERVIGHACISPGRKIDPGEKFDWQRLADNGLAIWTEPPACGEEGLPDEHRFRKAAAAFGYAVPPDRGWSEPLLDVWRSYAMRFLPHEVREGHCSPNAHGIAHLEALARRWPARRAAVLDPDAPSA